MARVKRVTARKDGPQACPQAKKGDVYYFWKHRMKGSRSGFFRCTVGRPPTRSETTLSDYRGQVYDIQDEIAASSAETVEEFDSLRDEWVERINDLCDEQRDKLDAMPEALQEGSVVQERIDECDEWSSEVEAVTVDEPNREDYPEEGDGYQGEYEEALANAIAEAISECAGMGP
jgi:hypothetical protein